MSRVRVEAEPCVHAYTTFLISCKDKLNQSKANSKLFKNNKILSDMITRIQVN
jgi:hypothetical protein